MRHARAGADPSRTVRQHQPKTPSESTSCFIPPDDAVVSLQDVLQIVSFNIYYTQLNGKIKMTMQEIMKKCFFSVLAFLPAEHWRKRADCILRGRGLQGQYRDGGCGRQSLPGWIIQVGSKKGGTKPPDPHALDLRKEGMVSPGRQYAGEKVKALNLTIQSLSTSEGIRTPVSALRGPRARPLHNGGI